MKDDFIFLEGGVFFPREKVLVIADVHIGYEEALNKQGVLIPRIQFKEIAQELKRILEKTGKLKGVVILGDLKHEFGEISQQEWQETSLFLDKLKEKSEKIVLIKGNHDTILEPIARRKGIEIKKSYARGGNYFIHGDKFPEKFNKKIKRVFVGHRHPAIKLSDGVKSEVFKVFLVGKWKGKEIAILPSFMPLIEGSEIINEKDSCFPFSLKNFRVYVIGNKIYEFGKVRELK